MIDNTDIQNTYLCPASFAQQRLWFLSQLLPNSPLYNIADVIRITNILDVPVLERSFNEIVCRHDSLRTTFTFIAGEPMQVIADSMALPLPIIDLTNVASLEERRNRAKQLTDQEAERPFDLAHGPLIRTTLIRIKQNDYLLLLTMHQVISDSWSMSVFMRELASLYTAFSQGKPSPLLKLPIQYADFTKWQHEWLQGEARSRLLNYWKRRLGGLLPLELPTDRPRPAFFSYRGSRLTFEVPASITHALKALSRQEDVTLFITLQAAFQTLLARYSGQNDIALGSLIANRSRIELKG